MGYFCSVFALELRRRLLSRRGLALALLLGVLCLLALLPGQRSAAVRVGLVLPPEGAPALEELLLERSSELVEFIPAGEEEAERRVLSGSWDCALVVAEDFGERLSELDSRDLFTLKIGPASTVYPLVQETVAGCMMELLSPHIARDYLERNGMDTSGLSAAVDAAAQAPRVEVVLQTLDGKPLSPPDLTDRSLGQLVCRLLGPVTVIWALLLAAELGRWLRDAGALRMLAVRSASQQLLPRLCAGMALPLGVCWVLAACCGGGWAALAYPGLWAAALALALAAAVLPGVYKGLPAALPFLAVASVLLENVLLDVTALLPGLKLLGFLPVSLYISGCGGSVAAVALVWLEALALIGLVCKWEKR